MIPNILILALILVESGGDPKAIGDNGLAYEHIFPESYFLIKMLPNMLTRIGSITMHLTPIRP